MAALDRTAQTAFFIAGHGGSNYLYENLFWFFGHPEVYIVALPGFGIVLELLPVFSRKPLWGYRVAVAGMLGVGLLSFFVWQHHLFVSGINADVPPVLHAGHRADLHPHRLHLPVLHGDALAGPNTLQRAHVVLHRLGVQLPLGRDIGRLSLGGPE